MIREYREEYNKYVSIAFNTSESDNNDCEVRNDRFWHKLLDMLLSWDMLCMHSYLPH